MAKWRSQKLLESVSGKNFAEEVLITGDALEALDVAWEVLSKTLIPREEELLRCAFASPRPSIPDWLASKTKKGGLEIVDLNAIGRQVFSKMLRKLRHPSRLSVVGLAIVKRPFTEEDAKNLLRKLYPGYVD